MTVDVPTGNVEPDGGVHVSDGFSSTSSAAVASYVTAAPARLVAGTVTVPGTVITGAVVSATGSTTTWNVSWLEFPRRRSRCT